MIKLADRMIAVTWMAIVVVTYAGVAQASALSWTEADGVIWKATRGEVHVDGAANGHGPFFRLGKQETLSGMTEVKVRKGWWGGSLMLEGVVVLPEGGSLIVRRKLQVKQVGGGEALTEQFDITGGENLKADLEIVRPFLIETKGGGALTCALPRKNGWFEQKAVDAGAIGQGEYRLGEWVGDEFKTGKPKEKGLSYDAAKQEDLAVPELALPVVALQRAGAGQGAVYADPYFSALFTVRDGSNGVTSGECRYRYWSSTVALEKTESRSFGFWLGDESKAEPTLRVPVDTFYALMLPEVAPGPRWLHGVYGSMYDCMYLQGESWKKDMDAMAKRFGPENTKHIVVAYHCWYDYLGRYCFDPKTGKIDDSWDCVPLKELRFKMTQAKMRDDLAYAKKLGFRPLIYFGDGISDCSGAPGYNPDWNWISLRGKNPGDRFNCWSPPKVNDGPRCFGRNPAHPEVIAWHQAYMKALLETFGDVIDGFVWDETFHIGTGYVAAKPVPSYSDRALMRLCRDLTRQVEAYNPELVFLASDNVGFAGCWGQSYPNGIPGYAMVCDGNFQDSASRFGYWPYCLFPNWRNKYWSCNWYTARHFGEMSAGARWFGTPVSFSTGGGYGCSEDKLDVSAPHVWDEALWSKYSEAFKQRLADGPKHVRYLTVPPEKIKEGKRNEQSQSW